MGQNRIQTVIEKYSKVYDNTEDLHKMVNFLSRFDPSGNQKYLDWGVKIAISKEINEYSKIGDIIIDFHNYNNSLSVEAITEYLKLNNITEVAIDGPYYKIRNNPKDIFSYPNYKLLSEILVYVTSIPTKKERKEKHWNECEIVHEDNSYLIINPLTHSASKFFGLNTKWCTAAKDTPTHFNSYSGDGNLYYIIDKERSDKDNPLSKIAYYIRFGDNIGQSFNAPDANLGDIENLLNSKYKKIILSHLTKDINIDLIIEAVQKEFKYEIGSSFSIGDGFKLQLKGQNKTNLIFGIYGFPDWSICFDMGKTTDGTCLAADITLLKKNKEIKNCYNDITYHRPTCIAASRSLIKGIKPPNIIDNFVLHRIRQHFSSDRKENDKDLTLKKIKSFVIYSELLKLMPRFSDKNWTARLKTTNTDFGKDLSLEIQLRNIKNKPLENFRIKIDFCKSDKKEGSFNIEYSTSSYENEKYEWDGFNDNIIITNGQENISTALLIIINKFKKHFSDKKKKKIPITTIPFRRDDWLRKDGYLVEDCDVDRYWDLDMSEVMRALAHGDLPASQVAKLLKMYEKWQK